METTLVVPTFAPLILNRMRNRGLVIFIMGLLSTIGPFSIDLYLPGFPAIAEGLHTDVATVQYSLSSYFAGICIGQLVVGPLLDRYGRRLPLFVGLGLYIMASVGCAFAPTVGMLIAFRFLQALGGCVGMVAPRAIVRDLFTVEEAPKIFATLMLMIAVSPILAPTVGGYIIAGYGWQAAFLLLALIGVAVWIAAFFWLEESRPPDPSFRLRPGPIIRNYGQVLAEPQFYTYTLMASTISAALYAYIAGSPAVVLQYFGMSKQAYGWIFAGMAVGLIGCSQVNTVLLRWYKSAAIMRAAMTAQAIIGVVMIGVSLSGLMSFWPLIVLLFLFLCCQGMIGPNGSALAMAPFRRLAGSASAMFGAFIMGFGAATSGLTGFVSDGTPGPMIGVMAGCSILAQAILRASARLGRVKTVKGDQEAAALEMVQEL